MLGGRQMCSGVQLLSNISNCLEAINMRTKRLVSTLLDINNGRIYSIYIFLMIIIITHTTLKLYLLSIPPMSHSTILLS